MKRKKIDNFKTWRDKMKIEGKIKSKYLPFKKDGNLAELIGVVLGDGHICRYPRTEEVRITSNSNNQGFILRYAKILEIVFGKKASIIKSSTSNATKITIYEKNISKRLGIPTGAKKDIDTKVPSWILNKKNYIVRYLRGLYEAEGCSCVHLPTYTHKFLFSNKNNSMLKNVYNLMRKLGFHPHVSKYQIQISRKDEVCEAIEVIGFRKY